ncbi:MAG: hypothetical protein WC595_06055 [Candidatus Nanoarchaeia archaeon]
MPSSQTVAFNFIEGSVQRNVVYVFQVLDKFIKQYGDEIEEAHAEFLALMGRTLSSLDGEELSSYINRDYKTAKAALQRYRVTMNLVENRIALFSSNFDLDDFMKESGLSRDLIGEVQGELRKYWKETYVLLLERIKVIYIHLQKLNEVLSEEVDVLENLPARKGMIVFDALHRLVILSEEEKRIFWELVKDLEVSKEEKNQASVLFYVQLKKVQTLGKAHLALLKSEAKDIESKVSESKRNYVRAVLVLFYLNGAATLLIQIRRDFREILIKKGIRALVVGAVERFASKRDDQIVGFSRKCMDVTIDQITAGSSKILSLVGI